MRKINPSIVPKDNPINMMMTTSILISFWLMLLLEKKLRAISKRLHLSHILYIKSQEKKHTSLMNISAVKAFFNIKMYKDVLFTIFLDIF